MNSHARLLRLTQQLYAAAMSERDWGSALEPMVELLRADHAMVIAGSPLGATAIAASARMNKADFNRFLSPEGGRWMAPLQNALPAGSAAIRSQLMSNREFESSDFYNELVRPAQGFHGIAARTGPPASTCFVALCRSRKARDFGTTDAAVLQAVLPHLQLALELHFKLRVAEQGRRQLRHVLDRLDTGVILTNARAHPVFVNAHAARLAAAEDGVKLDHTGLVAMSVEATRQLRAAVAATSAAAESVSRYVRLERTSGQPALLLTIMPIRQFDAAIAGIDGPSVAIVIREPRNPLTAAGLDLAGAFQLTRREKEVVSLIADGLTRLQVARKLGISEGTVRTHLQHMFDKTGTHRQIDLVRLLIQHTSSGAE